MRTDDLLVTIQSIHAAGLDPELLPDALEHVVRVTGSSAATLERYTPDGRLLELHTFGVPPAEQFDYLEHFSKINPRANFCLRHRDDPLHWDYKILDEPAMRRDPFYSEFLPRTGFRYFVSGQWFANNIMTTMSVQRSSRQGHAEKSDIEMVGRLLPHIRQAVDTTMRLRAARGRLNAFRDALDWLSDGVLLVRADGGFVYANAAMQAIARRGDGIRLARGRLEFSGAGARDRFDKALAAIARLETNDPSAPAAADFVVTSEPHRPSYLVALRPLPRHARFVPTQAIAIVFVRNTGSRSSGTARLHREVFGFTEAEAEVARALQAGTPLDVYARRRAVSLNTVYTHLRRIKEKTGCRRLTELIRRLNDIQLPLREE